MSLIKKTNIKLHSLGLQCFYSLHFVAEVIVFLIGFIRFQLFGDLFKNCHKDVPDLWRFLDPHRCSCRLPLLLWACSALCTASSWLCSVCRTGPSVRFCWSGQRLSKTGDAQEVALVEFPNFFWWFVKLFVVLFSSSGKTITWLTIQCGVCARSLKTSSSSMWGCSARCWPPAAFSWSSVLLRWSTGSSAASVEPATRDRQLSFR